MSIPTKKDLLGMDYSFQGQPFVEVAATADKYLTTMDYSFQGQPFVRNPTGGPNDTYFICSSLDPDTVDAYVDNVLVATWTAG